MGLQFNDTFTIMKVIMPVLSQGRVWSNIKHMIIVDTTDPNDWEGGWE